MFCYKCCTHNNDHRVKHTNFVSLVQQQQLKYISSCKCSRIHPYSEVHECNTCCICYGNCIVTFHCSNPIDPVQCNRQTKMSVFLLWFYCQCLEFAVWPHFHALLFFLLCHILFPTVRLHARHCVQSGFMLCHGKTVLFRDHLLYPK